MNEYGVERRNTADPKLGVAQIFTGFDMKLSDFEGKNITDIGAGISPFSTYIALNGQTEKITFVDPIYAQQSIQKLHEKNKHSIQDILSKKKDELEKNFPNNPYDDLYLFEHGLQGQAEYSYRTQMYDKSLKDITNIEENKNLINEWKDGIPSKKIVLNCSSGEGIVGIPDNSQDIVIMQYLLNNIDDPEIQKGLLREARRIATDGAYFLITHPRKESYFLTEIGDRSKIKELNNGFGPISFAKLKKTDIDTLLR